MELKNILGRQPGPEVAEQLAVYQENLKQKVAVPWIDCLQYPSYSSHDGANGTVRLPRGCT